LADVYCEDEVEEEIARAFAAGLDLDAVAGTGSPPTSPVADPSEPPALSAAIPAELKARTLMILDWDDTLLTTTRLTSCHGVLGPAAAIPLPDKLVKGLRLLEADVNRLLTACVARGKVVIVTNAAKGWVQQSGKRFVPNIIKHVTDLRIPIISAQEAFAASCPSGDPTDWKKKAFLREVTSAGPAAADMNFLSIGDSIFERAAAHYVGKRKGVGLTKTVKFIDMPTIDQLRRQLTMLTVRLDLIYRAERSLDVEMDV